MFKFSREIDDFRVFFVFIEKLRLQTAILNFNKNLKKKMLFFN